MKNLKDLQFNTQPSMNDSLRKIEVSEALARIHSGSERELLLYVATEIFSTRYKNSRDSCLENVEILFPEHKQKKLGEFTK